MKNVFLCLLMLVSFRAFAQAGDVCENAAWKVVNPYFDSYAQDFEASARAELAKGEEYDDANTPGGLEIQQNLSDVITFSWGERQECSCGVDVKTKKSRDGKSCKVRIDRKSQGCECG